MSPRLAAGCALLLLVAGCTSVPPIPYEPLRAPRACLPDAIGFEDAYLVWQRLHFQHRGHVLVRNFPDGRRHAVTRFFYRGRWYEYDPARGSYFVPELESR